MMGFYLHIKNKKMKRSGLILSTILLFILSLYIAYQQAYLPVADGLNVAQTLTSAKPSALALSDFQGNILMAFKGFMNGLTLLFGGSLLTAVVILALLVELVTLYPAVRIQLKQKKIHLFHKKLVDRFRSGELAMSKAKREQDVLYAVNETLHIQGAALTLIQLAVFVFVLIGLYLLSQDASLFTGMFNSFTFALLAKPVASNLPVIAALSYLLHAFLKIHVRQQEDYLSQKQILVAIGLSVLISMAVFVFASNFSTLLTVYFMTQVTFATMRYLVVEEKAKAWGKMAQKELIKMLKVAEAHKNTLQHLSRKFNHLSFVRHANFHLLEEGLSMSLLFMLMISFNHLI